MKTHHLGYLSFTLLLCSTIACTSTTTGADGNLKFSYYSTDKARDFNKPIAIGAKLDVTVADAGDNQGDDVVVNMVSSEDESIIKASAAGGDTITLEAMGKGSAEISVDATVARTNEVESDRFTMRTAVPEVVKLTHLCELGSNTATYLVGKKDVYLGFDMQLKDGQQVIGYGYYPLTPEPAEGATVRTDVKNHDYMRLHTGDTPGDVVLTSPVSDGSWTLKLVEEGAIDGAILEDNGSVGVGEQETYHVLPVTMGAKICQADLDFDLSTTTPDICDVKRITGDGLELTQGITKKSSWIEVSGKQVGDCKLSVSYAGGNNGAGATAELTVSVENE